MIRSRWTPFATRKGALPRSGSIALVKFLRGDILVRQERTVLVVSPLPAGKDGYPPLTSRERTLFSI